MAQKPERRPAAILFTELRNFTRLSEVLQPDKVLELANEFFSLAARAIKDHTGKVLSVHNDGLVAAFVVGEPAQFNDAAIKTAQVIQAEFGPIGERWQKEYGLPAAASSGVHSGDTLFGFAGPQGQQQFVGFGDSVSVAERLVHRARRRDSHIARRDEGARRGGTDAGRRGAAAARARRQAPAAAHLRHAARDAPGLYLEVEASRIAFASVSAG